MKSLDIPKDGLEGLKQNWRVDAVAGFLVLLLSLPLSLGIAKASEFPPAMGVLTAMIGGLVVSLFAGSRLTIKGPAAGLITICAGAVTELGGGTEGWRLALGVIVVASVLQIAFGYFKFGALSDFFPHSVVHGMLAAIGLIIFSKQIHVLLGIDPATLKGLDTIQLFEQIPDSLYHEDPRVTLVGLISLVIIFGMPFIKGKYVKKIPVPLVVLLVAVPMTAIMDFRHTEPAFDLVSIGDFWSNIGFNADFSAIGTFVFWKYVMMFLLVGSLESLLTVKAMDDLDPWKRISNSNKDLMAVGGGNVLAGLFGGLPMISEVARSSANINFGARSQWGNFFHGVFLLAAMLLFIPVIEMIPNTALAALLIAVGYRLASPNEFFKTYKIGAEQLTIFIITIIATLATDLLIGVGVGIVVKFIFHILNGAPLKSLFKPHYEISENDSVYSISVKEAAIFSNLIGFKKMFAQIKPGKKVIINFSDAKIVDHSFMEFLHHFEEEYHHSGGQLSVLGFDYFQHFSNHPLATRKLTPGSQTRYEVKLSPRQMELRKFADANDFAYFPQKVKTTLKYKNFPIQQGNKIPYEENILSMYGEFGKIEASDITVQEGARQFQNESPITIVQVSDIDFSVPDFALEPEGLWSKLFEGVSGKDIDFAVYPDFSKKYYLRGENEPEIGRFFTEPLIRFLENREEIHIECHKNRLIFFKKRDLLEPEEIHYIVKFAEEFMQLAQANLPDLAK
jgi:MFS superfamily sulfate permease-like transporter